VLLIVRGDTGVGADRVITSHASPIERVKSLIRPVD
jgi:hypothetical protein